MQTLRTADGTTLAYTDSATSPGAFRGTGTDTPTGPALVLLHGWTLDQQMWDHHVHRLSPEVRCVTYDRRGHGRSSVPDGGYDYDTLADDLAALLDHLDLADVTLVTHSMGAGEAVRYLSRHGRGRVTGVVMIAPVGPCATWAEDNPAGVTPEQVQAALDGLAHDRAHWFDRQRDAYFALPEQADRTSPATVELTLRQCLATPLAVQVACMRTMLTTDLRRDFATVDVPVQIVHGALDQSTPLDSCGRPAAALLPHVELQVHEDAGHGIYVTHRAEVEDVLRRAVAEPVPS